MRSLGLHLPSIFFCCWPSTQWLVVDGLGCCRSRDPLYYPFSYQTSSAGLPLWGLICPRIPFYFSNMTPSKKRSSMLLLLRLASLLLLGATSVEAYPLRSTSFQRSIIKPSHHSSTPLRSDSSSWRARLSSSSGYPRRQQLVASTSLFSRQSHQLFRSESSRSIHRYSNSALRGSSNSDHHPYTSTTFMEMGDPFQTLAKLFTATLKYTLNRFLAWCNRPNMTEYQQWAILLVYYFFHLMVLSQHCILFGWQLIPNSKGHFCSVGWDS
jgi:hypothetical protein